MVQLSTYKICINDSIINQSINLTNVFGSTVRLHIYTMYSRHIPTYVLVGSLLCSLLVITVIFVFAWPLSIQI